MSYVAGTLRKVVLFKDNTYTWGYSNSDCFSFYFVFLCYWLSNRQKGGGEYWFLQTTYQELQALRHWRSLFQISTNE